MPSSLHLYLVISNRERRERVYEAEPPFPFDSLLASGRMIAAASLASAELQASWSEPAVVVVSTCSLVSGEPVFIKVWPARWGQICLIVFSSFHEFVFQFTGPGAQLLRKWGHDRRNLLLLTRRADGRGPISGPPGRAATDGMRLMTCRLGPAAPSAEQLARVRPEAMHALFKL